MATLSLVLMIAALLLFLADAFGVNWGGDRRLQSLGLACVVGAALLGGATALAG